MSASITLAPRPANSRAVAKPMPLAPPVMTVARPSKFSTARRLRLIGPRFAQLAADRSPWVGVLARLLVVGTAAREEGSNEGDEKRQNVARPVCVRPHLSEHVLPRIVLELQGFLRAGSVHPFGDEPVVVVVGIACTALWEDVLEAAGVRECGTDIAVFDLV